MDPDLRDLLLAFNKHSVKYLIVGAYAVAVHAEPRATKDLDLFIKADPENSHAVFRALAEYGAPLAGLTPADFNDEVGSVFQMGQPPLRIDLLQKIEAIDFEDAWNKRLDTLIDHEVPAHVISADQLVENKIAVGRPQDVADVAKLRKAALHRRKRSAL